MARLAPPPLQVWARHRGQLGWLLICPRRPAAWFNVGTEEDREASPHAEVADRLREVGDRLPFLQDLELWHPQGGWLAVFPWRARVGRLTRRR